MRYLIIALFSVMMLTTACRNKDLIRPGDPVDVAYDKAMALFEAEKYDDAANGFDLVSRMGRGSNYSRDAQYYLGESYYKSNQYILAASEYERFMTYYPQDPRREGVEFKLAMCYYEQSPRYRLDQANTYKAIELFQLFNNKYPDSEFVIESAEHIDELRNKLAHKIMKSGDFYLRIEEYKAATIYFDQVIDQYPESDYAEEALIKQISTYITYADKSVPEKQRERYGEAISNYDKFLQLFPQSVLRPDAEQLNAEAERKIAGLSSISESDSTPSQD